MNKIIILLALISGSPAYAHVDCAGELNAGSIIHLSLATGGPMGAALGGYVSIKTSERATTLYAIKAGDIGQYFEDAEDQAVTWVGSQIFVDGVNPVNIKYRGINYLQRDLTEVLRDKTRVKQVGNTMRVWKGPGYKPEEQYAFRDVVCASFIDQ